MDEPLTNQTASEPNEPLKSKLVLSSPPENEGLVGSSKATDTEDGEVFPSSNPPAEDEMLTSTQKLHLAIGVTVLYAITWIVYLLFKSSIWDVSISISAPLSQMTTSFLAYYSWTFSTPLYEWYPLMTGMYLLLSVRKDRALTCLTAFWVSNVIRQYLRILLSEYRPEYVSLSVFNKSCDCTFGMPSGHSEGSATMWSLTFFNFMPAKSSTRLRVILIVAWFYIVFSTMFARVFYGRHTLAQVFIGSLQGAMCFTWMLVFEKQGNEYFRKILDGGMAQIKSLIIAASVFAIVVVTTWYTFLDNYMQYSNYAPVARCQTCFTGGLLKLRGQLGKDFCLSMMHVGLAYGLACGKIINPETNPNMLWNHFSWKGIARIIVIGIFYLPKLFAALVKPSDVFWIIPYFNLINVSVGFLLVFGDAYLRRIFSLEFHGDYLFGHGFS